MTLKDLETLIKETSSQGTFPPSYPAHPSMGAFIELIAKDGKSRIVHVGERKFIVSVKEV